MRRLAIKRFMFLTLFIFALAGQLKAGCPELVSFSIYGKAVDIANQLLKEDIVTDVYTDQKGESTILIVEKSAVEPLQASAERLLDKVRSLSSNAESRRKIDDLEAALNQKKLDNRGVFCSGMVCVVLSFLMPDAPPKALMLWGGVGLGAMGLIRSGAHLIETTRLVQARLHEMIENRKNLNKIGRQFTIGPVQSNAMDEIANIYGFDGHYQIIISASAEDRPSIRKQLSDSGFEEIKTALIDLKRKK